jgi:hypothetical protein
MRVRLIYGLGVGDGRNSDGSGAHIQAAVLTSKQRCAQSSSSAHIQAAVRTSKQRCAHPSSGAHIQAAVRTSKQRCAHPSSGAHTVKQEQKVDVWVAAGQSGGQSGGQSDRHRGLQRNTARACENTPMSRMKEWDHTHASSSMSMFRCSTAKSSISC